LWSAVIQLARMIDGKRVEHRSPLRRNLQEDATAIRPTGNVLTHNQPRLLAAIAEFHGGVVAEAETLSHIADRGVHVLWGSGDLKQKLMLLRMQAQILRCRLAEMEKQAQLMTKFRQELKPILYRRCRCVSRHSILYRITIYCEAYDHVRR
jgi:hypothetical protein